MANLAFFFSYLFFYLFCPITFMLSIGKVQKSTTSFTYYLAPFS